MIKCKAILPAVSLALLLLAAGCSPAAAPSTPPAAQAVQPDPADTKPPAAKTEATAISTLQVPVAVTVAPTTEPRLPVPSPTSAPDAAMAVPDFGAVGRTNQRADGNRVVAGQGDLPGLDPVDIPLDGLPNWVAAVPFGDGILWAVVLIDGTAQAFVVSGDTVTTMDITPSRLPVGMPPLFQVRDEEARLIVPAGPFSQATHPVFLNDAGDISYVDNLGQVVVQRGEEVTRLPVTALPDARLLVDEDGRLLLLSDPTSVYAHGVLGDGLEGSSITLIETQPQPRVLQTIPMPEPFVIEGIAPIWTDLDGDGRREIIVTRSSEVGGAQIVLYDESGNLLALGPDIGRAYRWRHQIAAAPFGPAGEIELVSVLTPHIGGHVEFYQWRGEALDIVAGLGGYTSHVIGSPNFDMALAGRFDASGQMMLLLPNQKRDELGGVRRTAGGAEIAWTLPVGGKVITNLAAAANEKGDIGVAVGRSDGLLRVWQP